jgi:hypothetical protein
MQESQHVVYPKDCLVSVLPKEVFDVTVSFFQKEFQQAEEAVAYWSLPEAERFAREQGKLEELRRRTMSR